MLILRYWQQWTNGAAESSLPFGPLRYRQWTSDNSTGNATSSLPFGPFRFRNWTSGAAVEPPPTDTGMPGYLFQPRRIRIPAAIQRDDDEIVVFLATLLQTGLL